MLVPPPPDGLELEVFKLERGEGVGVREEEPIPKLERMELLACSYKVLDITCGSLALIYSMLTFLG